MNEFLCMENCTNHTRRQQTILNFLGQMIGFGAVYLTTPSHSLRRNWLWPLQISYAEWRRNLEEQTDSYDLTPVFRCAAEYVIFILVVNASPEIELFRGSTIRLPIRGISIRFGFLVGHFYVCVRAVFTRKSELIEFSAVYQFSAAILYGFGCNLIYY